MNFLDIMSNCSSPNFALKEAPYAASLLLCKYSVAYGLSIDTMFDGVVMVITSAEIAQKRKICHTKNVRNSDC